MCRFIIFDGKMSWCLVWALEWKCYFHPSAIMGFLSPSSLLLFYFLTERQGGTPLPAQLGHWGSSPKPWGERPRATGRRALHLCGSVWSWVSLMEESWQSISGEDGCPLYHRPLSAHSRTSWVQPASLMGHQPFPGLMFVLVKFGLADSKGDQILRTNFRKKRSESLRAQIEVTAES